MRLTTPICIYEKGVLSAESYIPNLGIILVGYASKLQDAAGNVVGAIESVRDVTDIRRVEAELKEAEEKYRTILETMDSGYYEVDLKGNVLYFNPALRKFLGYGNQEMKSVNFSDWVVPEEIDRVYGIFKEVRRSGNPNVDFYVRVSRKNGEKAYSAVSSFPMRDEQGDIVGFSGTVRDITALKEAKDAADAANQSKSIFLANMSHEIRTPMNAILGFAQLIERDPQLSPRSREHLEIINRSGEHLMELINDILEMSKIEAGRATFVQNTFDLHALLRNIERMFHVRTDAKNLRFLVEMVGPVPQWVFTDEGKLRQVLINLLGNSVKFTREGGIALRLSCESRKGRYGRSSVRGGGYWSRHVRRGNRSPVSGIRADPDRHPDRRDRTWPVFEPGIRPNHGRIYFGGEHRRQGNDLPVRDPRPGRHGGADAIERGEKTHSALESRSGRYPGSDRRRQGNESSASVAITWNGRISDAGSRQRGGGGSYGP